MNNQNFLVVFAFVLFFVGLFTGKEIWSINQETRLSEIISCSGYENNFLKTLGFNDQEDCVKLNTALLKQYSDNCLKEIKTTTREDYNLKLLNSCIYYSFEKNAVFLESEYFVYKSK